MIVVLALVFRHYGDLAPDHAGRAGAQLGRARRSAEKLAQPARNYFLFLFQLLKYLEVFPPVVGAIVVPAW